MPGLGRIPSPRDTRDWSVDRLKAILSNRIVPVNWSDPVVLDQGETPHCVGYGCAGFLATAESAERGNPTVTNRDGERIYAEVKQIDSDGQEGSTVRSGAKALQKYENAIAAYAFGGFLEAKLWVEIHGPVVIGIDWHERMFHPSKAGVVTPTGTVAGGHCLLWHGTDIKVGRRRYNVLRNSWGPAWGIGGDCYVSDANLRKLLAAQGEALMAVRLR